MLFIFDSVRFEPFQQLLYFNTSRKCQAFFLKLSDQMQMDLLKIFAVLNHAEPRAAWRPGRLQNRAIIHPHTTVISALRKEHIKKKKKKVWENRFSESVSA